MHLHALPVSLYKKLSSNQKRAKTVRRQGKINEQKLLEENYKNDRNRRLITNVTSNFLKSVCAHNFQCATFHKRTSIFGAACMKYVQKSLVKKNLCALQVFLHAPISRPVCTRTL